MRNRCMALVLSIVILGASCGQALASLSEGSFVPCTVSMASATGQVYRIRQGDTLWDISRANKVDLHTLMALNHISERTVLKIGQELVLPSNGICLHYIKAGESMWKIAAGYDISVQELLKLNPGQNPQNLKIGTALKLPDRAQYRIAMAQPSRSFALTAVSLSWPVIGIITSRFGWRSSGFHHGLDIAAELGTPIKACAAGKVIFTGYKDIYGRIVIIEHYDGKQTLYAHIQKINVKPGQKVGKGQVIATVGTTGRTTGPHVHLEVKQDGKNVDPANYLKR
ncbi:MAG TPA: hypothetical protein DER33_08750 [Syntrophomonas sp.]|nr:hypothetical protein [Syntrophomonas sp.]HCF71651.1 hypothetical protein [Syntrophomonas sp.]